MIFFATFFVGIWTEELSFGGVSASSGNKLSRDMVRLIGADESQKQDTGFQGKKRIQEWLLRKRKAADKRLVDRVCPVEARFNEGAHKNVALSKREKIANDFMWFIELATKDQVCEFIECFGKELEDCVAIDRVFSGMESIYRRTKVSLDEDESHQKGFLSQLVSRTMGEWRQILQKMMEVFGQKQWFAGRASPAFRYMWSLPADDPVWFNVLTSKKAYQEANKKGGYFSRECRWIDSAHMSSYDFFQELEGLADEVLQFISQKYPDPQFYWAQAVILENRSQFPTAYPYFVDYAYQEVKKQFPEATEMHASWEQKLECVSGYAQFSLFFLKGSRVWYGVPARLWLKRIDAQWVPGSEPQSFFEMMKMVRFTINGGGFQFLQLHLIKEYEQVARPYFLSCEQEFRKHLETEVGQAQLEELRVTVDEVLQVMFAPAPVKGE
jgi:hypothetical protein